MIMELFDSAQTEWSDDMRQRVHGAVKAIAARCDGAFAEDGVGFNGTDTAFGKMIADLPVTAVADEALAGAYQMLKKYRRQLLDVGIDYDQLTVPVDKTLSRKSDVRSVFRDGNDFRIVFGYDPDLVSAVKQLPERRFDRDSKSWLVPIEFVNEVEAFGKLHNFAMDVGSVPAGLVARKNGSVSLLDGELVLKFNYDPLVHDRVRQLPSRRFDVSTKSWRVPLYLVKPCKALAERFDWDVAPEIFDLPDHDPTRPPVSVEVDAGMLKVRFPFTPALRDAMRLIPDAKWNRQDGGFWYVPVHRAATLVDIVGSIGSLASSSDMSALIAELDELVDASRALEADIVLPSTVGVEPFPFQAAGVAYLSRKRRSFLADHVGLGKTITSTITAEHLGAFPLIVFCPASLKINWLREVQRVLPERQTVMLEGTKPRQLSGGMFGDPEIIVCNYDIARWWTDELTKIAPRGVIADESHLLKEPTTFRTKAVVEVARCVPADGMVLALSATPVLNHRRELASQLDVLGRLKEFGGKRRVEYTDDINERLRAAGCFLRRTKDQVLTDLPRAIHSPIVVEPDSKVMRDYRRAEKDVLKFLAERAASIAEEYGLDPESAAMEARLRASGAEHLVMIGVLKRIAAQAKMPFVKQWTREFLQTGEKLLMFATHNDVVDALQKEFDCKAIRGGQSREQRQSVVDAFQNDPSTQIVALNLTAGGVGLTLTEASNVGFVEMGWSPAVHDQAIGRCYGRLNDPHGAVGHYFIAQGTIDERVVRLLDAKRREVDHATDGISPDDRPDADGSILGDLIVEMTREAMS
jgi:superfamily II DNA or RNA helicase